MNSQLGLLPWENGKYMNGVSEAGGEAEAGGIYHKESLVSEYHKISI